MNEKNEQSSGEETKQKLQNIINIVYKATVGQRKIKTH